MTAPGPPPMRYPRLRMAVGVLAAAFPVVVIFGIIPVYHWSRHVSFYRLNDVGYLSLGALIVAIVVLFVCLLTLLQLRRHLAAHAARDEQAAPRQAELDTAIGTPDADGLVSFVAAAPLEPGDHAAGAPLVDPYAYAPTPAELGRPVESTSTAHALLLRGDAPSVGLGEDR